MARVPTPCATPRCPELTTRGKCTGCWRKAEQQRGSSHRRGYDSAWERTRNAYLAAHPLCECDDITCREPAVHVDHEDGLGPKGPHGHDWNNLRSMTHSCHSKRTARDQPGGWAR